MNKTCPICKANIVGRIDKVFCSDYCKSLYHYEKRQGNEKLFKQIDKQLKLNRRILKLFNKAGKATVRSEKILEHGFDPNFFTHYWKNYNDDVYLFVYEYGFLKRIENGKIKYILVTYQDYMKHGNKA